MCTQPDAKRVQRRDPKSMCTILPEWRGLWRGITFPLMGIWCREGGTMIRTCSPSVVLAQLGEDYINIVIVNKGLTIFVVVEGL